MRPRPGQPDRIPNVGIPLACGLPSTPGSSPPTEVHRNCAGHVIQQRRAPTLVSHGHFLLLGALTLLAKLMNCVYTRTASCITRSRTSVRPRVQEETPGIATVTGQGSNAWAIAASLSATHHAILANDAHLALSVPVCARLLSLGNPA